MNAVIPALERGLEDYDIGVRVFSEQSLGWLRKDTEKVVPALAANLSKSTNVTERITLLEALGNFWSNAKTARAQVASFLNDTNSDVSMVASNALRRIDSGKSPH